MRRHYVQLRLLAMVLMAFGLIASSGLAASAAPAAPTGAHVERYQSVDVDICITLFNAALLNSDGSVVDPPTFAAGAANIGITDVTLINAVIDGGCSGFPVPTPVGTTQPLPTLPPVATATTAPPTATIAPPTATTAAPTSTLAAPTATTAVTPSVTPTAATTPDPATEGTVNVSVFSCSNLSAPVFHAGEIMAAAAPIPSSDGTCSPDAGLFTFYFVGDGTNAFAQLAVDGSNSIGLPAGDYEVVEENTQLRVFITVTDGGVLSLVLSLPIAGAPTPVPSNEGTVNVSKFYCAGLTETVFQAAPVVNEVPVGIAAADAGIPATAGECTPGPATVTFYLVGDGTNAFAQLSVDGTGSIGLPAGDYEVVEEETQAHNFITVTEGGILTLVISNPFLTPTVTPVITPTTAPGVTPTVAPGVTPTAASSTASSTKVNALPNTGQGSAGNNNDALILLFGAMSVLLVAGVAVRQRRTR